MNAAATPGAPSLTRLYGRALIGARRHGTELPETRYTIAEQSIDRDRLADYQRLCGFPVGDVLPPTYLHLLAFPLAVELMTEPGFPLPLAGLVHVANSITVRRPVIAGDRVTVRVHAEQLRPHPAGRQFDVIATASVADEQMWSARSTYLRRADTGPRSARPDRPAERPTPEPAPGTPKLVRVPGDLGRRYAAVSGDRNPIHLSAATARLFGFRTAIAHGMWLNARVLADLEGRLPDEFTVDVAFKRPVPLPSTVAIATQHQDAGWTLDVRSARTGKPHLIGTLTTG